MADYIWGTSPKIYFSVTSTVAREGNGTSDRYSGNITVTLGEMRGTHYFGYNIYCKVDNGTAKLLKDNSPSQWDAGDYSETFAVSGSTAASLVSFSVKMYSTTASRSAETFTFNVTIGAKTPVPPPVVTSGWFTVERDNSGSDASGITEWVCGYSKAKVTFDSSKVTVASTATISSFSVIYDGSETTAESNIARTGIIKEANATITVKVTDSLGRSTTAEYSITALEYSKPTITDISIYRSDNLMVADDEGHYITAKGTPGYTSLNGKNSITFRAYYKQSGGSYGSAVALQSNTLTIVNGTEISELYSYVVRLTATDALGNMAAYEQIVNSEGIPFHIKNGGKGVAIGKRAETDYLFDVAWPANFAAGIISGAAMIRVITDVAHMTPNPPTGWIAGVNYGRVIIIGSDTDSARYYICIEYTGDLWVGYGENNAQITWYKK